MNILKTEFFMSDPHAFQKTMGFLNGHHAAIEEVRKKRNDFMDKIISSDVEIVNEKIDFEIIQGNSIQHAHLIAIITVSYYTKDK